VSSTTDRLNRFGPQPLRGVLARKGVTLANLARLNDIPYAHMIMIARGRTRPSPAACERLPKFLGVPLEELFSSDALAKPYDGQRLRKAVRP
jgi:transcriptional regulator with XRE-family HTH domain